MRGSEREPGRSIPPEDRSWLEQVNSPTFQGGKPAELPDLVPGTSYGAAKEPKTRIGRAIKKVIVNLKHKKS